jgi:hypothetical protein
MNGWFYLNWWESCSEQLLQSKKLLQSEKPLQSENPLQSPLRSRLY